MEKEDDTNTTKDSTIAGYDESNVQNLSSWLSTINGHA